MQVTKDTVQHIKGDTYMGDTIDLEPLTIEDFTLVGASIRCALRLNNANGAVALTLADGSGLTITGDKQFEVDRQIINIASGSYYSDFEITLANGEIYTPIIRTWLIIQDSTN